MSGLTGMTVIIAEGELVLLRFLSVNFNGANFRLKGSDSFVSFTCRYYYKGEKPV